MEAERCRITTLNAGAKSRDELSRGMETASAGALVCVATPNCFNDATSAVKFETSLKLELPWKLSSERKDRR
jgi:hypothetical protein